MVQALGQSCDVYFYDLARRVGIDAIAAMAGPLRARPQARHRPARRAARSDPDHAPGRRRRSAKAGRRARPWSAASARASSRRRRCSSRSWRPGWPMAGWPSRPGWSHAAGRGAGTHRRVGRCLAGRRADRHARGRPRGPRHRARVRPWACPASRWRQDRHLPGAPHLPRRARRGPAQAQGHPLDERDHALFVCFAPLASPRYAVSVIVEHGMSGSKAAAPIARDIMRKALELDPGRRPAARGRRHGVMSGRRAAASARDRPVAAARSSPALHWPLVGAAAADRAGRLRHALLGRRRLARALGMAARRAAGAWACR